MNRRYSALALLYAAVSVLAAHLSGCGNGPLAGTDVGNAGKIAGVLTDGDGRPVANHAVFLRTADYEQGPDSLYPMVGKEWSSLTRPDGSFAFTLDSADSGDFVVEALVDDAEGARAAFRRESGRGAKVDLVLRETGAVGGAAGLPSGGGGAISVSLPGTRHYAYFPDGTGNFAFPGLPPGPYVLRVRGFQPRRLPADTTIEVVSGKTSAATLTAGPLKIKALIVDGIANHDWGRMTAYHSAILRETGIFEVAVSTLPPAGSAPGKRAGWNPRFQEFDVVILHCNSGHPDRDSANPWPDSIRARLESFVAGGGGLVNTHATFPGYAGWPAFDAMHGLGWRYYGAAGPSYRLDTLDNLEEDPATIDLGSFEADAQKGASTRIRLANPGHPINRGLPVQWMHAGSSLPFRLKGDPAGLTVLAGAINPVTGGREPLSWTKLHGKGRVFTNALGHLLPGEENAPYRCAGYQATFARGVEWTASGQVTLPVPQDFPGADSASLRDNLP